MFIRKRHGAYYASDGSQHSGRGDYLALFSWNKYKADGVEGPSYPNGKPLLWATVRVCVLTQMGHWMMGTIRIGGQSITVSGSGGCDGLPLDIQAVPEKWRTALVPVPESVATAYWADNGHNDIGQAAPTLRQWARQERALWESGK